MKWRIGAETYIAAADAANNRLPGNHLFIFADLVDRLQPPIDLVPLGDFWDPDGVGGRALQDITNIQRACSLWNATAKAFGALWGAFVPAAETVQALSRVLVRAQGANIRLAYRATIPKAVTDALLHRATAIYAGDDCPWRHFARTLRGTLPVLEVLILHPRTNEMPSLPLRSFDHSLYAPFLRICDVWCPLRLVAPRLQRLGMRYYTPAQILSTLAGLADVSLQRLEIENICVTVDLDYTGLLDGVRTDRLRFLRIAAPNNLSGALNVDGERLHFPDMTTLDVSGPIWLRAPLAASVKIFNADANEILCMLHGLPGVNTLHVRPRPVWDLTPRATVLADHHITLPVPVHCATVIQVAGVMSQQTLDLMSGISIPALQSLTMFCDMPTEPQHQVLRDARSTIHAAMVAEELNQVPNAATVLDCLTEAARLLRRAGHHAMCIRFHTIPGHPGEWPATHGIEWASAATTARATIQALDEAYQRPEAVHNGVLLRRVVDAALTAIGVDALDDSADIDIWPGDRSIRFVAVVNAGQCTLNFSMANTRTNEWPTSTWHSWERTDSRTFGMARMLWGLSSLQPRSMRFQGDMLRHLPAGFGDGDVRLLREALHLYDRLEVLRLDYSFFGRYELLLPRALSDAHTLPGLKRMIVVCAQTRDSPLGEDIAGEYVGEEIGPGLVVSAVQNMLSMRAENGERLETLELEGSFCLQEAYGRGLASIVPEVILENVVCKRPGGAHLCGQCSWRRTSML